MNIQTLRSHFIVGVATLALAACSGADKPAPQPEESATAAETSAPVEEAAATEAAPMPTPAPTPSPSTTPSPSPAATPSAAPSKAAAAPAAPVAVAAPPPTTWARCAVCHNAEKGAPDKLGPNLFGVYGHKMGQGSFAFSDAVKNSGLTLDDATLDKWLENPRALIPGNRMSFPGLKDPAKRAEIIAWLKQQR